MSEDIPGYDAWKLATPPEYEYDEPDEFWEDDEDIDDQCCGYFEMGSGRFVCGAVGSEDCDWCKCNDWLGLTSDEVDALEDAP